MQVTFDAVEGTLSFAVNNVAQGVGFTGLHGKVLFPAIAFYSSGRSASVSLITTTGTLLLTCVSLLSSVNVFAGLTSLHPMWPVQVAWFHLTGAQP